MVPRPRPRLLRRFLALLRFEAPDLRQGFVALFFTSLGNLLAGLTLGSITGTLEALPGLLVLVPAAIDMRGNVFGALGSRLGTAIHTGTFRLSLRRDSLVGQNLASAVVLSLVLSLALACLAKVVATAFGVGRTISIADFVVISVLGGALSSIVVLVITVRLAVTCARRDWDLDNVAAPAVTAVGDVVTLPSLFLATYVASLRIVTPVVASLAAAVCLVALVLGLRSTRLFLRRIMRESLPILLLAGVVSVVAGVVVEQRVETFLALPALLVLLPPFLADAGALGGILAARVSTKLHLGVVQPRVTVRPIAPDLMLIVAFALPLFLLVGVSAGVAARMVGLVGPGLPTMIAVSLLAGTLATTLAIVIACSTAMLAYRFDLDPDNYGIPVVTSVVDLLGAGSLILVIVALGLT